MQIAMNRTEQAQKGIIIKKKSEHLCDKNTPWLYMRTDTGRLLKKIYENHLGSDSSFCMLILLMTMFVSPFHWLFHNDLK